MGRSLPCWSPQVCPAAAWRYGVGTEYVLHLGVVSDTSLFYFKASQMCSKKLPAVEMWEGVRRDDNIVTISSLSRNQLHHSREGCLKRLEPENAVSRGL